MAILLSLISMGHTCLHASDMPHSSYIKSELKADRQNTKNQDVTLLEVPPSAAHKTSISSDPQRISLHFQDISVRAVLQLLAEFSGINIVVSDAVTGNITLQLNEIPWEQALDLIITTKGLDKRRMNNIILIDEASAFMNRKKKNWQESQESKKFAPLYSRWLQINHAKASDLANLLKDKTSALLSEQGSVSADSRTNMLLVQDNVHKIQELQKMVSHLDVPVKQVLIEARIVTMSKESALDLGARFGVSKSPYFSGTLAGAEEGLNGSIPSLSDRLNIDLRALPIDASPMSIGVALAGLAKGALLDLELSALESEGRAEIIASPRLMTTNQQSALIEAGEDIPYQEATVSGATAVSFKKAVLRLKVTPQITSDGKLLMDLQINQDSDSGRRVQGVPIILTKAVATNVRVANGQTIILGGIHKQDKNNVVTRMPGFGKIPIVGALFRRTQVRMKNEELLIFITPRIIN